VKIAPKFLNGVRDLIVAAHSTVGRGVDLVQVHTNLEIGRRIVQEEQRGKDRAAYGKQVIGALADRLTAEFGKGFSETNLKFMRLFYPQNLQRIRQSPTDESLAVAKRQSVTDESEPPALRPFTLNWTHYVVLLGIKDQNERSFYETEANQQNWTVRELKRQFASGLYERLALSRNKKGIRRLASDGQTIAHSRDLLKEPLVLEFLGLEERSRYSESDLESAIISQIERFLLEMGKGFLFESRQRRFTFDEDHFFVDLVFYNRPAALLCPARFENRKDRPTGPRADASTPGNISFTCPANASFSKISWNGSGNRMPLFRKMLRHHPPPTTHLPRPSSVELLK